MQTLPVRIRVGGLHCRRREDPPCTGTPGQAADRQRTLPLPILDSHPAAPLVLGDTMYLVAPKPNRVYVLDPARNGFVKWKFRASPSCR